MKAYAIIFDSQLH